MHALFPNALILLHEISPYQSIKLRFKNRHPMITVTLGTSVYPFDRLLIWLDSLFEKSVISEPLFLQYGSSTIGCIRHNNLMVSASLVPQTVLEEKISHSRLVIAHAGDASTQKLANKNVSFVIVPRIPELGEHVDDHQLSFSERAKAMGVTVCSSLEELELAVLNPPKPLNRDLFQGPKLTSYLLDKYAAYCG